MTLSGLSSLPWKFPKALPRGRVERVSPPVFEAAERFRALFPEDGAHLRHKLREAALAFVRYLGVDDLWIVPEANRGRRDSNGARAVGFNLYVVGDAKKLVRLLQMRGAFWRLAGAKLAGEERLAYSREEYVDEARGAWINIHPAHGGIVAWSEWDDYLLPGFFDLAGLDVDNDTMLPLPRPGLPYATFDYADTFYSVVKDVWLRGVGAAPDWDPCAIPMVDRYGAADGPVLLDNGVGPAARLISVVDSEEIAAWTPHCGRALLWPSIAATWRQHEWEGDIAFYFDVRMLTNALGGRKMKQVYVFDGDGWTPTKTTLDSITLDARGELRGRGPANELGNWLSVLGPQDIENAAGWGNIEARRIKSMAGFERRLKQLQKIHKARGEVATARPIDRYPYLEMKVLDRIPLADIPLAVVTSNDVRWTLLGLGFGGTILVLDQRPPAPRFDAPAYCDLVDAAVEKWAHANGRLIGRKP